MVGKYNAETNTKYKNQEEEIDKSAVPRMIVRKYKRTMRQLQIHDTQWKTETKTNTKMKKRKLTSLMSPGRLLGNTDDDQDKRKNKNEDKQNDEFGSSI